MKKLFLSALALICLGFNAAAQEVPQYTGENAESAFILDVKTYKDAKDLMILVDQVNSESKVFDLYVWKKNKGWVKDDETLSLAHLDDFARYGRYKIPMVGWFGMPIYKYDYIAIVPQTGTKYSYATQVKNHDIYIYLQPAESTYEELKNNAKEVDISTVNAKASSEFEFYCDAEIENSIGLYVFGKKESEWKFLGTAYLKEKKRQKQADYYKH